MDDTDDATKQACRTALEMAEGYLLDGRRYIALQRERIDLLKAIGSSTDEAMQDLNEIEDLLVELEEIRDALRRLAGEASHPSLH